VHHRSCGHASLALRITCSARSIRPCSSRVGTRSRCARASPHAVGSADDVAAGPGRARGTGPRACPAEQATAAHGRADTIAASGRSWAHRTVSRVQTRAAPERRDAKNLEEQRWDDPRLRTTQRGQMPTRRFFVVVRVAHTARCALPDDMIRSRPSPPLTRTTRCSIRSCPTSTTPRASSVPCFPSRSALGRPGVCSRRAGPRLRRPAR